MISVVTMTNPLYESDENEKIQRPLLDSSNRPNINSDTSNIILYESPEKEPCVTILSDAKSLPKDKFVQFFC